MPQPRYYLSSRQAKELLVRGRALQIAIPLPPDYPDDLDPIEFARRSLVEVEPHLVTAAEEREIAVTPMSRSAGLVAMLGSLETDARTPWQVLIVCVVAVLTPPGRERQAPGPLQWPGDVRVGDWRLRPPANHEGKVCSLDSPPPGGSGAQAHQPAAGSRRRETPVSATAAPTRNLSASGFFSAQKTIRESLAALSPDDRADMAQLLPDLVGADGDVRQAAESAAREIIDDPPATVGSLMRWYISAAAVQQYMAIAGYRGGPDSDEFDAAAIELERLCDEAKLARDVGPGQHSQIWRGKATISGRRRRLEYIVSIEPREEGPLPQLIGVRDKGAS